jgi:hypothetical protein
MTNPTSPSSRATPDRRESAKIERLVADLEVVRARLPRSGRHATTASSSAPCAGKF